MKKLCFGLMIVSVLCACKQQKSGNGKVEKKVVDSTKFFQIAQFIQSEVTAVNKTPYYIYRISITHNKRDSTPVNNEIFNTLSNQFYNPDVNDPNLKKEYTENIFFDQTNKNYTISYSTTNKNLVVQNMEILLNEDAHTVTKIFIRKFFNYPDSSAIEQLIWTPGKRFQINRAVQKQDNTESSSQTIVVWNDKE